MGALQRADRLKEPPVVGRWYMVPAIWWNWGDVGGSFEMGENSLWWPVWGIKHTDIEHFNFRYPHYHVDPRFLTRKHWSEFGGPWILAPLSQVQAAPLNSGYSKVKIPKPTLCRMRCSRSHSEWMHHDRTPTIELNAALSGQQCRRGKRGWVCPHKLFPLGSIESIDGVITCPLHGLRINAETGVCLGSAA